MAPDLLADVGVGSVLGALILLVALFDFLEERIGSMRQFHHFLLGMLAGGRAL